MNTRIRQRRKEKGLSQAELAEKTGLTQTTISTIEKGKSDTTTKALCQIAKALDVSIDWLLFGETNEDTANKPPEREFSKQQLELIEITDKMTDQQQTELLGAVKMYLLNLNI